MTDLRESTCPGCGLRMPVSDTAAYEGYYNTSPECWDVKSVSKNLTRCPRYGRLKTHQHHM